MTIHVCKKCGYQTISTTSLKLHLNRKNPCNKNKINISQSNLIGSQSNLIGSQSNLIGSQSNLIGSQSNLKDLNKLQCKYCLKIFTLKTNLTRHKKVYCKKYLKKLEVEFVYESDDGDECEYKDKLLQKLNKKVTELEETMKELKEKPTIINQHQHVHVYVVPMDQKSIKYIFDTYYGEDEFYSGPNKIIEILYETMFKKDIKLLDVARATFQYMVKDVEDYNDEENDEENENENEDYLECKTKVIKDIKNYKVLQNITEEYKKRTNSICISQMKKYSGDSSMCETVLKQSDKHKKCLNDIGYWSRIWTQTVGK